MQNRTYFTYMVASRSRTLYIGVTSNLSARVLQHKQKMFKGFTAQYNCDRLIWFESFSEIEHAIAREKQLKGWSRAKKIALIVTANPTWEDMSEQWYPHLQSTPNTVSP
jgi:putative endonuclease